MKRKIEVIAGNIRITATINAPRNAKGEGLARDEVEYARIYLADSLQDVAAKVPFFAMPRHRVVVR